MGGSTAGDCSTVSGQTWTFSGSGGNSGQWLWLTHSTTADARYPRDEGGSAGFDGQFGSVASGTVTSPGTAGYWALGWWDGNGSVTLELTDGPGSSLPDSDGDGWPDDDETACGSDPEDEEDFCSSLPPQPSGWPSAPPAQPGEGGGPVDQCEGPDDAALPMCGGEMNFPTFPPIEICPEGSEAAVCQPEASFSSGGEEGEGTEEDGGLGGGLGNGVTECEGENLTPVESKVGYIAPEPVPSVAPLEGRLAGFGIFTLAQAPQYLMNGIGWVGDMVGVVPASVRNTATGVYNGAVHLIVPGDCVETIVQTKVEEIMEEPPFSIFTDVREGIESGTGAGRLTVPGIPIPGSAETIPLPFEEIEPTMATLRPYLAAAVWLFGLIAVARIVVGSFHVGKGTEE